VAGIYEALCSAAAAPAGAEAGALAVHEMTPLHTAAYRNDRVRENTVRPPAQVTRLETSKDVDRTSAHPHRRTEAHGSASPNSLPETTEPCCVAAVLGVHRVASMLQAATNETPLKIFDPEDFRDTHRQASACRCAARRSPQKDRRLVHRVRI